MRISDWSSDVCSSDLRLSQPSIWGRSGGLGLVAEDLVGELLENVLRRGLAVGVGLAVVGEAGLLEPGLHHAVVDDGGIAPGAHAEAEVVLADQHAHLAGELDRKSTRLNSSH